MNKRQKKKKINKYGYTWGYSYHQARMYYRKFHETRIKYLRICKYFNKEGE